MNNTDDPKLESLSPLKATRTWQITKGNRTLAEITTNLLSQTYVDMLIYLSCRGI